jgi:HEAT repeat protein
MIRTARLYTLIFLAFLTALTAQCGPSPKVFAERMNSGDASTRRDAARDLRGKRRVKGKLIPVLLQACRDPDVNVRMYGYYAISRSDPYEEGVVSAIIDGIADTSVEVRRAVASSLGLIDPFPSTCLPHLVRMLADRDEKVRSLAFAAVVDREGGAMGSLMRSIDTKDDKLRLAVINVMAQIGAPAKQALPKLRQIAREDENDELRKAAERAVKFIEE